MRKPPAANWRLSLFGSGRTIGCGNCMVSPAVCAGNRSDAMEKVFCKNCVKFVVINTETNERVEANHHLRKTGNHIFINKQGHTRQYVPTPVCHVGRRKDWLDYETTDEPEKLLKQISLG